MEDIVTQKKTEGTFSYMKKFWTYIKRHKYWTSRNLIIKTKLHINYWPYSQSKCYEWSA
jgi:hypothetical protein